jgi:two-component system LytT family response regulator
MLTKKIITTLIVDDLPYIQEGLRIQLEMLDNVKVLGMASDVNEAFEMILRLKPQLVFLDVNLPDKSGFDLAEDLKKYPEINPDIVFVTGYSEHALKSYDYYPFHFLVKPISRQKIREVIEKYSEYAFGKDLEVKTKTASKQKEKLHFKGEDGYIWINYNDVLWFNADRNYTVIYLKQGIKEIVSENIGTIENMLTNKVFFRSHRSYIINYSYILKIHKQSGKLTFRINPFEEIPLVAKENIPKLIDLLNKSQKS